jgi:outer membrane protein TolC
MLTVVGKYILILHMVVISPILSMSQERTLDDYIRIGLLNSPLMKDYDNQIRINSADSLLTRAGYLPQVNVNGYMMYAPIINGYGYSEPITNGQNLTGTFNVSQNIFNKKTKESEYNQYGIENRSLSNTRKISANEMEREITGQFLAACAAFLEMSFEREVLSTMKDEEKLLGTLVEKGAYRQIEYLSFRVEIASVERGINDLDLQFRKELANLNILCGIPDTVFYKLSLPDLKLKGHLQIENSPLFHRFVIDSLKIVNEKVRIDRKYKPSFNWFSDAGLVNNEPKYIYQNFGISLGMSMTLPVYDGNRRKLSYSKLKSSEATRKNYENFFLLQYSLQLKQLENELEQTQHLVMDNEEQVKLANELVSQDKILLNIGSVSVTDYVLATKNLMEARQNQARYKVKELQIINEINFLRH